MRRHLSPWLLLLLLAGPLAADERGSDPERPRPIGGLTFLDEVETTVVSILTYVTDADGQPVTGLEASDFRVLQDGEARPITNFYAFTEAEVREVQRLQARPEAVAAEQQATLPELLPVYMVLYVDHRNLHPLDRNRVLAQATSFVREHLQPPVQMMVVSADRSPKVLQAFTDDQQAVLEAVRGMRRYSGGRNSRDDERRDILEQMERYRYDPGSGDGPIRAKHLITAFAEAEATDLLFTLDALRSVLSSVSGLPGKKAVVYISNGLPMMPGMGLWTAYASIYNDPSALTNIPEFDRTRLFESVTSAANAADVSFYTLDATGLRAEALSSSEHRSVRDPSAGSASQMNYLNGIRHLADNTGGIAVFNTNDYAAGFARVARDLYTYYSIGYPLSTSGRDRVHRVEVQVPGHPEYTVRHRQRVIEKSRETRVQDTVVTALMLGLDENPMGVQLSTGRPSLADADRFMLPVHVSFPLEMVAMLPEGDEYVGRVVLFLGSRDDDGRQSSLVRQEHDIRIPAASLAEASAERWAVDLTLLMDRGQHRLAVGLMDQVTRQASYQTATALVGPPGS